MNIENTQAQMRKGILEYCILLIISQQDAYVPDIISKLKASKMIVVEGTVYCHTAGKSRNKVLPASITVSRNKGEVFSRNSKTPGMN